MWRAADVIQTATNTTLHHLHATFRSRAQVVIPKVNELVHIFLTPSFGVYYY